MNKSVKHYVLKSYDLLKIYYVSHHMLIGIQGYVIIYIQARGDADQQPGYQ